MLHYGNITWTTGTFSQGDPDTGKGGTPALVCENNAIFDIT